MDRRLVERDRELVDLTHLVGQAATGLGHVVLVFGEAGIGKSRLVEAMRARMPASGRMLVGRCDDLGTPRTLGPFRDLVGSVSAGLAAALESGTDRDRLLTALLAELQHRDRPTLLAVEDIHWADEATLDVLRYLARRIGELPAVLMLTYRDDEVPIGPSLQQLLVAAGGSDRCRRMPLSRLSAAAVRELAAGSSLDPDELYEVTAGSPFFVSELLASGSIGHVPPTVVDSVQDRLRRLPASGRAAVQQLAVIPSAIDRWLVDEIIPGGLLTLAEAEEAGLLTVTPQRVSFRHELARRAVADSLSGIRRAELNRVVLTALISHSGSDVAHVVHHASAAGDREAILRFAPIAAQDAAVSGAHREAGTHYRAALEYADGLSRDEHARLLEEYAVESYVVGDGAEAVSAQLTAIELRQSLQDHLAVGQGLSWLARMQWWDGNRQAAEQTIAKAIAVLDRLGTSRELARAYSHQSQLDILAHKAIEAQQGAERAVAMARATGDQATVAHALTTIGASRWQLGEPGATDVLHEALRIALETGAVEDACRTYVYLAWNLIDNFWAGDAEPYVAAGLELAERTEQFGWLDMLYIIRGTALTAQGAWAEAARTAGHAIGPRAHFRCPALTVLGRVKARTGDPEATAVLSSALELSHRIGETLWIGYAAAASAEDAWLRGDLGAIPDIAAEPYEEARRLRIRSSWPWPELAFWLTKAGHPVQPFGIDSPYELLIAGRWQEAAERWGAAGYRYESALALSESPDPQDQLAALDVLHALGARPLAQLVRRKLRQHGVSSVPRGPVVSTRSNPQGLTSRQYEVLQLLAAGVTDAEIAERLVISVRTASNHVAAVLAKLGVHNRAEARKQAAKWLAAGSGKP
ncbi:ATP-binding protein [Microlunatus speluncae]|uniref:ATP-binding protein n=1 Tax=Microlunatus speluncae TaxID=2594267 RepID=UPI00126617F1|nr:AAA family ATPase [Microlunatus speluncae]